MGKSAAQRKADKEAKEAQDQEAQASVSTSENVDSSERSGPITPESKESKQTVESAMKNVEEYELKSHECSMKLKSGKGGLVIIPKKDFKKYEKTFEIVDEGKKKS